MNWTYFHVFKKLGYHPTRHGIRQLRSGWADGPAYVTQCPIQTGQSYVYNYTIVGQRGTLFWHAHISWLRSTLYGPIIILPKQGAPYPFTKPYKEVPIIFGNKKVTVTSYHSVPIFTLMYLGVTYLWHAYNNIFQENGGIQILRQS